MSRLFVVRHGNTFAAGEPPRRIGAATDLPLVPSGIAQAQALGRSFRGGGIAFARAYAGPLLRTRQTAALILAEAVDPPEPVPADWLAEIDHGPDENRPEAEVIARIGAAALQAWESEAIPPPGWHSDGATRVAAWRRLMAAAPAGDTLLVTSNGAARFALLALADRHALPADLKLATGHYGLLTRGADGAWTVDGWDCGA